MTNVSHKSQLLKDIGDVEDAINALGAAYGRLVATYESSYRGKPVHVIQNLASTIGTERFNEDIAGKLNAAGIAPVLAKATARGGEQRHFVTDLRGEFERRLGGVGSLLD